MRKWITAIAALLALLFAPVPWGLPPPDAVAAFAVPAWGCCLELNQQLDKTDTQEPDQELTGHL